MKPSNLVERPAKSIVDRRLIPRTAIVAFVFIQACHRAPPPVETSRPQPSIDSAALVRPTPAPPVVSLHRQPSADEKGLSAQGIPRYIKDAFTSDERALLKDAFGVESPERLYFSDSSDAAILKYDVAVKRCPTCFVNSYRLGFVSTRRQGETWDQFDARLRTMRAKDFSKSTSAIRKSVDDLDPEARTAFDSLLASARRARFHLTVLETYRTPEREALLLSLGSGRTYTATSMHSYGRAMDIRVDDGDMKNPKTKAEWVRFRRFVTVSAGGQFRLVGKVADTWDWTHVELPGTRIGFHSVDEALAFARRCLAASALSVTADPCVIQPRAPATAH